MQHDNEDGRLSYDVAERQQAMLQRYKAIDPENRGVIVVDTCSLFSLSGKALQDKHYFDILTTLSEHGYEIMIPDMVAFEASQVLSNGKNVGDYFQPKKNRDHPGLVEWMKEVAEGKYPNISIVPTLEPAPIADFMEGLLKITNLHPPGYTARRQILDLQDKYRNRKNWGDIAIQEIVKALPSSPPVHVLTQDYRFLNDIAPSLPELNVLTAPGLLLTLAESGLSQAIPFLDPYANANELLASCNQSLVEQGRSQWTSQAMVDVSMKVALADPPLPHDVPMNISLTHTARSLGHDRPDPTRSVIAADIPTADEEEDRHLRHSRRKNAIARRYLKGGLGDDRSRF